MNLVLLKMLRTNYSFVGWLVGFLGPTAHQPCRLFNPKPPPIQIDLP